jgi:hypothetical protein
LILARVHSAQLLFTAIAAIHQLYARSLASKRASSTPALNTVSIFRILMKQLKSLTFDRSY